MRVEELTLLPRPRKVEAAEGSFVVMASTPIGVGAVPGIQVLHAARGLQAALLDLFGFSPPITPALRFPTSSAHSPSGVTPSVSSIRIARIRRARESNRSRVSKAPS